MAESQSDRSRSPEDERARASADEPHAPPPDPVGDLLMGLALAVIAAVVVIEALRMPIRGPLGLATSPGFVPLLVGGAALLLSLILAAINSARGGYRGMRAWFRTAFAQEESRRLLVLIVLITAYVLILGRMPFWLATFLFLIAIFVYLRATRWWLIPVYAGVAAFAVAWLLPWLFDMPVP